jgi:putative membrane protein
MYLLYLKAIHIIFVVTWFAGLFYLPRLFIYFVEAEEEEPAARMVLRRQYKLMMRRLWNIITAPSMVLAVGSGLWLMIGYQYYLVAWMWVKFGLVVGLLGYHFVCLRMLKQLLRDEIRYSAAQLRMWNEVATLFLFAIVFIVILKGALSWIWATLSLIGLAVLLMLGIRAYKRYRERHPEA